MAEMTAEVSKLLEQSLSLSVEEQEALADSLISSLGDKVDEGMQAAWEAEVAKRLAELDSGRAKTTSWDEVRQRNLAKLPGGRRSDLTRKLPRSNPDRPGTPALGPRVRRIHIGSYSGSSHLC